MKKNRTHDLLLACLHSYGFMYLQYLAPHDQDAPGSDLLTFNTLVKIIIVIFLQIDLPAYH
jgi:hypothetical protein